MDLKTEIKRNTLFNLMRYREHLINKLNEFSKIKFDESIKMMIFEVSYDLNKFNINIKCDVINQEDKKIENFFEGKEINEKIINNLRLFSPFHFNQIKEFDYEGLMNEFQVIVGELMNKNPDHFGPRITQIVDKYLGKGKKVSDATIDQAEFISLIVEEIKDELM
jgi:hypothetical protein